MTRWGVQRSGYYGKGDDPGAPGIWEPGRPAPTRKEAGVLRHCGVGSPPAGGVYAIGA